MDMTDIAERYELMTERISQIPSEQSVPEKYRDYFRETAEFLGHAGRILQQKQEGKLEDRTLEECRRDQNVLYRHILPEHYETSYANPAYACEKLGEEAGQILTFLRSELDAAIDCAFEGDLTVFTILLELYVQIYNCFEEEDLKEAKQTIYWFFHDYSEVFVEKQIHEMVCPEDNFFTDIILHADLSDVRYLYRYGLPVGENEIGIAKFLGAMSQ